jgi:hypothetical protein
MEFRQTTEHADREMFNADAVIRCGSQCSGQGQGLDSAETTKWNSRSFDDIILVIRQGGVAGKLQHRVIWSHRQIS